MVQHSCVGGRPSARLSFTLVRPLCLALGLLAAAPLDAAAATRTWTGLGGNAHFSTPGNWENNTPPVDGDALVFPSGPINVNVDNDIAGLRVLALTIRQQYELDGLGIELDTGGLVTSTSVSPIELKLDVTLVGDQIWTFEQGGHLFVTGHIELGGHTLTLDVQENVQAHSASVIAGNGALVKIGAGYFTLMANSTYTGPTTVRAGGLVLANDQALGFTDGTTTNGTLVEQTGRLSLSSSAFEIAEALTFNGTPEINPEPLSMLDCFAACLFSGPVRIAGTAWLGRNHPTPGNPEMHFSQPLTGPGAVRFMHSSNVVLEAPDSDLPGGITIGTFAPTTGTSRLVLQTTQGLTGSTGVINLLETADRHSELIIVDETNRAAAITGGGLIELQFPSASLDLTGAGTYQFSGRLKGNGIIRHTGAGTQVFTGNNPDFTGTVEADAGTVALSSGSLRHVTTVDGGRFEFRSGDQLARLSGTLIATAGTVASRSDAIGQVLQGVTFGPSGTFVSESLPKALTPGAIAVEGTATIGGATLVLAWDPAYAPILNTELPLIINDGNDPVVGTFAGLPQNTEISIPNSNLKVRLSYAGGDGNDVTLLVIESFRDYLLSEGATGDFFTTDILLANSRLQPADVRLFFLKSDGATVTLDRTLAPQSRTTVRVNDVAGMSGTEFSTVIRSLTAAPIVVERTMSWDADGYGAHTEHAADAAALDWYFAEGAQGFFSTYLLLANPHAVPIEATVTYLRENEPAVVRQYPLAASSRRTIDASADEDLVGRAFGMKVAFDQPGMAERAMYFGEAPLWKGGHESAGSPSLSQTWFLAEGATGSFFTTFVLIANPNDSAAEVAMMFYPQDGGQPIVVNKEVPAQSRLTVNIALEDPALANAAVATEVTSSVPVVVERAQYWPGPADQWYEAHNSLGMTASSPFWVLAEGRVGGPREYQTYILLQNTTDTDSEVLITFLREAGAPVQKEFLVPARSRFNVAIGPGLDVPELQNESFAASILSSQSIAVERALYWNVDGVLWAAGTNATGVVP